MIEPTIGRIVWYRPAPGAAYPQIDDKPHAAIIADVQSPSVVNLGVFAPSGDTYPARGVLLLQDGQPLPIHGAYAEWMPFQKGQAAKADQLQGQVETAKSATATAAAPAAPGNAPAATMAPTGATAPAPHGTQAAHAGPQATLWAPEGADPDPALQAAETAGAEPAPVAVAPAPEHPPAASAPEEPPPRRSDAGIVEAN